MTVTGTPDQLKRIHQELSNGDRLNYAPATDAPFEIFLGDTHLAYVNDAETAQNICRVANIMLDYSKSVSVTTDEVCP